MNEREISRWGRDKLVVQTFWQIFEGEIFSPEENVTPFFARRLAVDVFIEKDFHAVSKRIVWDMSDSLIRLTSSSSVDLSPRESKYPENYPFLNHEFSWWFPTTCVSSCSRATNNRPSIVLIVDSNSSSHSCFEFQYIGTRNNVHRCCPARSARCSDEDDGCDMYPAWVAWE